MSEPDATRSSHDAEARQVTNGHLSRAMSHALRHAPETYGLHVDAEGWVELGALVNGIADTHPAWRAITIKDVKDLVETASKRRFEIKGPLIRARYGHSITLAERSPETPPARLYHGTTRASLDQILEHGLWPMGRYKVHLAEHPAAALSVGRRRTPHPVLVQVDALTASQSGIAFHGVGDGIWLAEPIPSPFLTVLTAPGLQQHRRGDLDD